MRFLVDRPDARRAAAAAVPFGFLLLFFYFPLAALVVRGIASPSGLSLERFGALFASPHLRHVLLFTAEQAAISTLASVAIGFPIAYLLANYEFPGARLIKSLTIVPFALPAVTVALGFVITYGNNGIVNNALRSLLHVERTPLPILYSLQGIILAHAFYNAPIVARFVTSAWERMPKHYAESARSMGASRSRVFLEITLPILMPALTSAATLVFVYSFLSFPIVLAIGGASFTTIEVEIYQRAIVAIDYAGASALATLELVLALAFTWIYLRIERSYTRRIGSGPLLVRRPLFPTLKSAFDVRRWLVVFALLFLCCFFFVPIASVVVDSFIRRSGNGSFFTLAWYGQVLAPRYSPLIAASPLHSITNSLAFAASSMLVALILGTLLASVLARTRRRGLETFIMAPIGASPVALGFALLWAFVRPPLALTGTWAAIVIAHSVLAIPFVVRAVRPAFSRIEGSLTESARSLGASTFRTTLDIVLPLAAGAFISAAAFAFAVSVAETSATIMLTKPNLLTMPVAIYYLLAGRQFGAASAMAVLFMAVTAVSILVIDRFGERAVGGNP